MNKKIVTNGKENFIKVFKVDKEAPNIIFIISPIGSVGDDHVQNFFKGLVNKSCNVFGLDFLGIGKSEGSSKDITIDNMRLSMRSLINYIKENYNSNIHLYGGTGAGGIIGQSMMGFREISKDLKSLIQYGVAIYKDTSTMGKTSNLKYFVK